MPNGTEMTIPPAPYTRAPPMPWTRLAAILGLTVVGVTAGALVARKAMASEPTKPKNGGNGKGTNGTPETPQVNIETAMPAREDFPAGWVVEDEGFGEIPGNSRIVWRLLRLNVPSNKCSPDFCTYVSVASGVRKSPSVSTHGWAAHTTRDRALAEIERKLTEIAGNA